MNRKTLSFVAVLATVASVSMTVGCGPVGDLGTGSGAPGGARSGDGSDGTDGNGNGGSGGGTSGGNTNGGGGNGGTYTGVKIAGTYDVETKFNLIDALPPNIAEPFDLVLRIADSPGGALLDEAGKLPIVKYVVDVLNLIPSLRNQVTSRIDEYINRWSGGMVVAMHDLSADVQAALKGMKTHHKFEIAAPDATGHAVVDDTLVDMTFVYKNVDYRYPSGAHIVTSAEINGFQVTLAEHAYDRGVNIGGLLVDLIDNVALPNLTGVNSLAALLNQLVNCGGVGTWIYSNVSNICLDSSNPNTCVYHYLDEADFTKLCTNAFKAVGNAIEQQIENLDAPGNISVTEAKFLALDNMRTGKADTLTGGTWTLRLPVASTSINLPGQFTGAPIH